MTDDLNAQMNIEFTVTETVTRHRGNIIKIHHQFEEVTTEKGSFGVITNMKERRIRIFETSVTRDQYNRLAEKIPNALSFENFIIVLCPFVMGYYQNDELKQAFQLLDKTNSGTIRIDQLGKFLSIINEFITIDSLKNYITNVNINTDGNLTYDEFRTLILKGIGHDIICSQK